MSRVAALATLLLTGCPRQVPAHLQVDAGGPAAAESAAPTERDALVGWMLRGDPLARATRLPPDATLATVQDADGVRTFTAAVTALEREGADPALRLRETLDRHAGTPAVPLARGYLLRRVELQLAEMVGAGDQRPLVTLLTPLRVQPSDESLTLDPLRFLDGPDAVRRWAERWTLTAWSHAPDMPLAAVQQALQTPQHSGLAASPAGRWVLARQPANDTDPSPGFAALERATLLSLTRAAADRDREQAAWAELKLDARDATGTDDPERALLEQSFQALLAAGADDDAAGGALVAMAALRWLDACADPPCGGLDRVELFTAATRFGPRAAQLARVWQVIALKDALDSMDAGHDTVVFATAARQLADALLGTGAGPIDASLLMRSRGDAAAWLTLSRATGGDGATEWPTARERLADHVRGVATRARDGLADHPDAQTLQPLIQRIHDRATK